MEDVGVDGEGDGVGVGVTKLPPPERLGTGVGVVESLEARGVELSGDRVVSSPRINPKPDLFSDPRGARKLFRKLKAF